MPGLARLGDKSYVAVDIHSCSSCPHSAIGPATSGSPDVLVNNKPALRVGDNGVHSGCCGPNTWQAAAGCETVLINHKPAHRLGDRDRHCGGWGEMVEASKDVLVGS